MDAYPLHYLVKLLEGEGIVRSGDYKGYGLHEVELITLRCIRVFTRPFHVILNNSYKFSSKVFYASKLNGIHRFYSLPPPSSYLFFFLFLLEKKHAPPPARPPPPLLLFAGLFF